MRLFAVMSSALVCACGPVSDPHDGETSGAGSQGTGGAVTAMLDASGPHGSSGGATMGSTDAASTIGSSEESDSEQADDGPKLDAGPSGVVGVCTPSDAQQIDLDVVTPGGPFAATYAWWAWDQCCSEHPRLILSEVAELEVADHQQILTPHVAVGVFGSSGHRGPYSGPQLIGVSFGLVGNISQYETGFVLLEPLDPGVPAEGELPMFSATFAIEGEDWSISGSVEAPYCVDATGPPCPCE